MDHAHRGETALASSDFTSAIEHYSAALVVQPTAATYYIKRATAYQRTSQFSLALADAEKAVNLATQRAKRELIAQAQLRRGIALYQLGRYADAKFCLEKAKAKNEKEKSVDMWLHQAQQKLKDATEEQKLVQVKELPDVAIDEKPKKSESPKVNGQSDVKASAPVVSKDAALVAPQQTPKEKIRHDWYQTSETVTVTLLAKGVPKDKAVVEFQPTSLNISFPLDTGSTFDFSLEPLYAPIKLEESSYRVLSTKIEVVLKKVNAGQKWAALEGTETAPLTSNTQDQSSSKPKEGSAPSYPTSSRKGPKNWDQIAQSYSKPAPSSKKKGDKDEDADGDESSEEDAKEEDKDDMYIDDYEDGDPANAFFKKLYAGADPDTRRAMVKSFQESGGTALSTDWKDVSKKKVEVSPPDGMEERKWEV